MLHLRKNLIHRQNAILIFFQIVMKRSDNASPMITFIVDSFCFNTQLAHPKTVYLLVLYCGDSRNRTASKWVVTIHIKIIECDSAVIFEVGFNCTRRILKLLISIAEWLNFFAPEFCFFYQTNWDHRCFFHTKLTRFDYAHSHTRYK